MVLLQGTAGSRSGPSSCDLITPLSSCCRGPCLPTPAPHHHQRQGQRQQAGCLGRRTSSRIVRCSAGNEGGEAGKASSGSSNSDSTLANLDALLGIPPEEPQPEPRAAKQQADSSSSGATAAAAQGAGEGAESGEADEQEGWWSASPQQTRAPRKEGMAGGKEGRFIEAEFLTQGGQEARVGAPSEEGEELNIPAVTPRITFALLGVNLAVYSLGVWLALTQGADASNDYFLKLAKDNTAVVAGEYYRLLTSTFLHAGVLHLGLNCYSLWALGTEVEAVVGYVPFLAIYMLSGLSGAVVSFAVSDAVTVGASGAIFGLLGALAAYFARNRGVRDANRQLLFVFLLVSFNLLLGMGEDGVIDNTGHIAGFVAGGWLGWGMGPKYVVLREVDIPDNSMTVPKDAREVQVVVDQTTDLQRWSVAASFALSLAVALAAGIAVRSQGL